MYVFIYEIFNAILLYFDNLFHTLQQIAFKKIRLQ
jgi:hypothetical protein